MLCNSYKIYEMRERRGGTHFLPEITPPPELCA